MTETKKADFDLKAYRLDICQKCDYLEPKQPINHNSVCRFCGCFVEYKASYNGNGFRCGKGKW